MLTITTASTDEQLEQILGLQRQYQARALSAEAQAAEGFLSIEHSLELLQRMASLSPQAIALSDGQVIGYCLSLPLSLQAEIPRLAPMFEHLERCAYRGRPLSTYRFVVGGQVCIDKAHRGKDLLRGLYHQVRLALAGSADLCVTEIAVRNPVSLRAHEKMGFERVSTYRDPWEEWAVVAWDLA